MPTSPHQYRFRIRYSNGMGDCLVLGRVDNIRPYNLFRQMMSEWPGGRGRPPLHCVDRYVLRKARADNIRPYNLVWQMMLDRPGRRGRRPLQFVPADDVGSSGRPRTASPTIRFWKRHSNGRADNIRPYIYAYIFPMAGTSSSGRSRKKPPPEGGGFALLEIEMIFDDIHDEQVHHCCAGCEKSAEYQDSCCGVVREIL